MCWIFIVIKSVKWNVTIMDVRFLGSWRSPDSVKADDGFWYEDVFPRPLFANCLGSQQESYMNLMDLHRAYIIDQMYRCFPNLDTWQQSASAFPNDFFWFRHESPRAFLSSLGSWRWSSCKLKACRTVVASGKWSIAYKSYSNLFRYIDIWHAACLTICPITFNIIQTLYGW